MLECDYINRGARIHYFLRVRVKVREIRVCL